MQKQETTTIQTKRCVMCGEAGIMTLPVEGLEKYLKGEFVQVAFPELSPSDREMLISGTHSACWDTMWKEID